MQIIMRVSICRGFLSRIWTCNWSSVAGNGSIVSGTVPHGREKFHQSISCLWKHGNFCVLALLFLVTSSSLSSFFAISNPLLCTLARMGGTEFLNLQDASAIVEPHYDEQTVGCAGNTGGKSLPLLHLENQLCPENAGEHHHDEVFFPLLLSGSATEACKFLQNCLLHQWM